MIINRSGNNISVTVENGNTSTSSSVESLLLLAILEKLEEIRCGIVDVESAVNPR